MLAICSQAGNFFIINPNHIPILLLDPDRQFAAVFAKLLQRAGYQVREVRRVESALREAQREPPNIIIKPYLTERRGKPTGCMEQLRRQIPDTQFIFVQEGLGVRQAMRAVQRGAFDCLPLPCSPEQLLESVQRALEHQRLVAADPVILRRLSEPGHPNILTGDSPGMREVQTIIERVAGTEVTVLITGESGTGKELVARLLHQRSHRAEGPFLAVNCAALPDTMIESELFGHVRGAFTGAIADKPGRFELAAGGTLFLDEIGDLSPMGQADLLRVLEDGIFRPIGSRETRRADVRVVAATNHDLAASCREGKFREDLLFRLNVITVHLPPLRNRPGDLPRLAEVFLQHFCARHGRPLKTFSPEALAELADFPWPGNVRQLRNLIERLVLLEPARVLLPNHLPAHLRPASADENPLPSWEDLTLRQAQAHLARRMVSRCGGNKSEAARRLDISRRTLQILLQTPAPTPVNPLPLRKDSRPEQT